MDIFYHSTIFCFLAFVSARPREELVEYLTEFTAQCPNGMEPQILARENDFFKVKITRNSLNEDPRNVIYGTNRQVEIGSGSCYIVKAKKSGLLLEYCGTSKNTEEFKGMFNFVQDDGNVISIPVNIEPTIVRDSNCWVGWNQFEVSNLKSIKICVKGRKVVKFSDMFLAMCV